uniref:Uncharacterized protein n=1 Tax=Caenorhabditis japonica TaxID=281687 RepID=A0A8R1EN76_CAEJA
MFGRSTTDTEITEASYGPKNRRKGNDFHIGSLNVRSISDQSKAEAFDLLAVNSGCKLTWLPGVQRHCQKTSAPRVTLQKAPSEQSNDSGEEPFSSTEVGKGSSALEWNKVLWSDESKYLMIGTDGVTLVRRPGDKRNDPKYQVPTVQHGGGNVMM